MSLHVATLLRARPRVSAVAPSLQLIRGFGKNPEDEESKDDTTSTNPIEKPKPTNIKSLLAQFPKHQASQHTNSKVNPTKFMSPVTQIEQTQFLTESHQESIDEIEKTAITSDEIDHDPHVDFRSMLSQFKKPTRHLKQRQFDNKSKVMPPRRRNFKEYVSQPPVTKWSKEHSPFSDGPRLGWFEIPSEDAELMKPTEPCFYEEDEAARVESLLRLRPLNGFEMMMKDSKYHWKYPIDNEADRGEEENVGFEEHVLLDHLIRDGFPKRGPVRHFMELVVEGLSKNHHYSAQEKRGFIDWYRQYFSQFPQEELETAFPHDAGQVPSI